MTYNGGNISLKPYRLLDLLTLGHRDLPFRKEKGKGEKGEM